MQGDGIIVFVKWCIIAIGISLFMPTSLEGKYIKDNRSSKANTTYVKQMDRRVYSQSQNQRNSTLEPILGRVEEVKSVEEMKAESKKSMKTEKQEFKEILKTVFTYLGVAIAVIVVVCVLGVLVILSCAAGIGLLIYYLVTRDKRNRRSPE